MARKRNQLKDLERDERKNKSCRGDGRGARESAGKRRGRGERGGKMGPGRKVISQVLEGRLAWKVLGVSLRRSTRDWEEVCGRNQCLWSQMAWDVASGSVIYCEVM